MDNVAIVVDDTVARLRAHGAELLGEVAQFESIFRLCYLRGRRASSSPWPNRSADASLQEGTTQPCSVRSRTGGPSGLSAQGVGKVLGSDAERK